MGVIVIVTITAPGKGLELARSGEIWNMFSLPACDCFPLPVYTLSLPVIGSVGALAGRRGHTGIIRNDGIEYGCLTCAS
eukprot:4921368-Pyramimonas_sp.AAC.1